MTRILDPVIFNILEGMYLSRLTIARITLVATGIGLDNPPVAKNDRGLR